MDATDAGGSRPWWKVTGFWLLIVLIGAALAASAWTIAVASRGADRALGGETIPGLGMANDPGIAKEARARTLGLQGRIAVGAAGIGLSLRPAQDAPTLRLQLLHPYAGSHDLVLTLVRGGDGGYAVALPAALEAVRYQVIVEGADWRIGGVWKPGSEAILGPGM